MENHKLIADLALPAPVLVVEDNPLVRNRIESLLLQLGYVRDALVMVGSLKEARNYLTDEADHAVSLALVDLGLPDGNGIELIGELHASIPGLPIMVISAWSTQEAILAALRAGAIGYVLKERDDLEIAVALRSVLRGGAPIDPFIARRIIDELPAINAAQAPNPAQTQAHAQVQTQTEPLDNAGLSQRESTILHLVVDGLNNREIAERLYLSRYTVESHIKNVYRKLSVSSRTQAAHEARRRKLLG